MSHRPYWKVNIVTRTLLRFVPCISYCRYLTTKVQVQPEPPIVEEADDAHLTLMERQSWTRRLGRRLLPLRYRDVLPEALPPIHPPQPCSMDGSTHVPASLDDQTPEGTKTEASPARRLIQRLFATKPNKFGLSRHYSSIAPPTHDPEEHITIEDLSDVLEPAKPEPLSPEAFSPYPNRNAFLLGDWYWNSGVQKSQSSFQSLIDVVGDPTFSPTDVREVSWKDVNRKLAADDEWIDENVGWERTPVSISVPFQPRRGAPSDCDAVPQQFTINDFYHRNLVSVIREKIQSAIDDDFFHYEPYNLKWQSTSYPDPVNVHGELYTSEAFIDADRELQNSLPEPKCNAPRHVVALMFSSDSTKLTSFGDASLWPLYLYFGNESKYRRCKPSCHLGNHVAYFQKVSLLCSHVAMFHVLMSPPRSFQIPSRNLLPNNQEAKVLRVTRS